MIINVKKVLIFGVKEEIDRFFSKVQKEGFVEFISPKKRRIEGEAVKDYISAIKILKKQPVIEKPFSETIFPISSIAERVVHVDSTLESLLEEQKELEREISRISFLGDFSLEDLKYLREEGKRIVQFFCVKSNKKKDEKVLEELIYIGTQYDLDYFVAINKEEKSYPRMVELKIEKSLAMVKYRLEIVEKEIKKLTAELKELSGYLDLFRKALIESLNKQNLAKAKGSIFFPMEEALFAIEAWIPETYVDSFYQITKDMALQFEFIAREQKERVPTYMKNRGVARVGEDLVNIYDVPATSDKDPSIWVLFAFTIFFSMIVADAGYGLLFLILGIFLKIKFPKPKAALRRFTKLILILSAGCVLWGGVIGSFFGKGVDLEHPLDRFTVINYIIEKKADYHIQLKDEVFKNWQEKYPQISQAASGRQFLLQAVKIDDKRKIFEPLESFKNNILMEVSILLGVIHIALSFFRYLRRNLAGIGWICFMIGGYLYFPSILRATSLIVYLKWIDINLAYKLGYYLVFIGIGGALLASFIQRGIRGIGEITSLVQIFADVLSYLRLYALGLAGMIMATTFNGIAADLGLILGIFVVFMGHSINIGLAIMGGVIHGLRLNFIEWYHYCFKGDGKLFNPLRLLK